MRGRGETGVMQTESSAGLMTAGRSAIGLAPAYGSCSSSIRFVERFGFTAPTAVRVWWMRAASSTAKT